MTAVPLRAALREATERLAACDVASPAYDAQELAAHLLGVDRAGLIRHPTLDGEAYGALVARRASREPLQHITGHAYFRRLTLAIGSGVFVPRPETEVMTGVAVDLATGLPSPLVVDLYSGAGPIALSVAHEVPHATVHAVEKSASAVGWLRRNAAGSRVVVHHEDVATCLGELDGRVDIVVANPPYIPDGAVIRDPEVATHDPPMALWSGPDGLTDMRVLERVGWRLLRPGGWLLAEHGDLQGESVPAVFAAAGWAEVSDHPDLGGRPRFVTARKPAILGD